MQSVFPVHKYIGEVAGTPFCRIVNVPTSALHGKAGPPPTPQAESW